MNRITSLFRKVIAYMTLMRPFTLLSPFIATICGVLMSVTVHGEMHRVSENLGVIICASITMALAQMCGQIINQSEDPVELDVINHKSYRPIPQGRITQSEARWMGLIAGMAAFILAFLINEGFGLGITIILFFAVFYSVEPIRVKRRKVVNTLWLGISRGFLPLPVAWSIFYSPFEVLPLVLGVVLFFWVSGFQITKDFPDMEGDRRFGIRTFPVVYGIKNTKKFMHAMNGLAFALLGMLILTRTLHDSFSFALVFFPIGIFIIHRTNKRSKKTKVMENGLEWMFFYIGLGLLYICFTVALVTA